MLMVTGCTSVMHANIYARCHPLMLSTMDTLLIIVTLSRSGAAVSSYLPTHIAIVVSGGVGCVEQLEIG